MRGGAGADRLDRVTRLDLERRPLLLFWEATRACGLACRHCRAEAQPEPLPGELTGDEARSLVASLASFGRPAPILVVTGGEALERPDLSELVGEARALGVHVALSPSVTPLLTPERLAPLWALGVRRVSVSLDGATPETHEGIRGVPDHFAATVTAIRMLRSLGFTVQVNTLVARETVEELPGVAEIVARSGATAWELFFLVHVGRGTALAGLTPEDNEDVCHFLYDASAYGFAVRTVEAPFFRRVTATRDAGRPFAAGLLYGRLSTDLRARLGAPATRPRAHTRSTRDGGGILFVSHAGDVFPSGFLPLVLGNVRWNDLATLYREHPLLQEIRSGRFEGRCGDCEFVDLCGGSRARAYATSGDPLGEDPACPYVPVSRRPPARRRSRQPAA